MTHEELLTKLSKDWNGTPFIHQALSAAVELHRPNKRPTWLPIQFQGYGCFNCGGNYPCATIKAIEKELP